MSPIERLTEARATLNSAERRVGYLVRVARDPQHIYSDGQQHSWQEIGTALGTTRQAAQQRFA